MAVTANGRSGSTPGSRSGRQRSGRRRKEPASLTERTYQVLRRDILTCAIEPGSEISEADIADRLSISKTPVREALGRLRVEGFVKTFPRRGYQIVPLTIAVSPNSRTLTTRCCMLTGSALPLSNSPAIIWFRVVTSPVAVLFSMFCPGFVGSPLENVARISTVETEPLPSTCSATQVP